MKILLTAAAVSFGVFSAITPQAQADSQHEPPQPNDIVSFVPSGPILPPGIKFPYMDPDQLFDEDDTPDTVAINQLWSAYVFYHDTNDGPRLASLFIPDGVFDQEFNNNGTLVPASGVGGQGCILRGRAQIAEFISLEKKNAPPLTFPGTSHHKVSSLLIKVDGDEAVMIAPWFSLSFNATTGVTGVSDGGTYMTKFKRTSNEGWLIEANHIVFDFPRGAPPLDLSPQTICNLNGPVSTN